MICGSLVTSMSDGREVPAPRALLRRMIFLSSEGVGDAGNTSDGQRHVAAPHLDGPLTRRFSGGLLGSAKGVWCASSHRLPITSSSLVDHQTKVGMRCQQNESGES